MHLDLYTLSVVGVTMGLAISLSFTLLGTVLRGLPALRIWAAAFWVLSAGAVLHGLDDGSSLVSGVIGNGMIAMANALLLMGIAVHLNYPLRWRWPLALVGGYLVLRAALLYWPLSARVPGGVFGVHSVIWDTWMIWVLLRRAPAELRAVCAFAAAVFAIDAGFFLTRLMLTLPPVEGDVSLLGQWLDAGNYLFEMIFALLLATGLCMMLARRLTLDLQRLARTDSLTGLLNRMAAMEEGSRQVQRCRSRIAPCCVALLDLDRFKSINDGWGHAGGDEVLRHFTGVVQTLDLPADAVFARYGGEEFVLVLPGITPAQTGVIAEQLRERVTQQPAHFAGNSIPLTVSIGLTALTASNSFETMITAADAALYSAKANGRNRVEWDYNVGARDGPPVLEEAYVR